MDLRYVSYDLWHIRVASPFADILTFKSQWQQYFLMEDEKLLDTHHGVIDIFLRSCFKALYIPIMYTDQEDNSSDFISDVFMAASQDYRNEEQ